jgi:hypothetical protein
LVGHRIGARLDDLLERAGLVLGIALHRLHQIGDQVVGGSSPACYSIIFKDLSSYR